MSFPYREKMNNLRTGDIFEKDGVIYAALSGPSFCGPILLHNDRDNTKNYERKNDF